MLIRSAEEARDSPPVPLVPYAMFWRRNEPHSVYELVGSVPLWSVIMPSVEAEFAWVTKRSSISSTRDVKERSLTDGLEYMSLRVIMYPWLSEMKMKVRRFVKYYFFNVWFV